MKIGNQVLKTKKKKLLQWLQNLCLEKLEQQHAIVTGLV